MFEDSVNTTFIMENDMHITTRNKLKQQDFEGCVLVTIFIFVVAFFSKSYLPLIVVLSHWAGYIDRRLYMNKIFSKKE